MNQEAEDLKRFFGRERLMAVAGAEGVTVKGSKMACPDPGCAGAEKPDSCSVSVAAEGYGVWHCHRCDVGGDIYSLLALRRGWSISKDFPQLLDVVRELAGSPKLKEVKARKPRERWPDLEQVWEALPTEDATGLDYLRGRGLEASAARGLVRFNVGKSWRTWLNGKSKDGFRVAVRLYSADGRLEQLQLRNIQPGVAKGDSKWSCPWPYPPLGVAMGTVTEWKTAERVFVAEGIADTLALQLAGVAVVGAPGTGEVVKLANFVGNVRGRQVVLCPQNDAPSRRAFADLAARLDRVGAVVLEQPTPAPHKDPAEWLQAAGIEAFRAHLTSPVPVVRQIGEDDGEEEEAGQGAGVAFPTAGGAALRVVPFRREDPRPAIEITTQERDVADEVIAALVDDEVLYERATALVHVIRSGAGDDVSIRRAPEAPRIVVAASAFLRERITAKVVLEKFDKRSGETVKAHPPPWLVAAIYARGDWPGLRRLSGVTEVPVLRADGSVLEEPGYDPVTGLLYHPNGDFLDVPAAPKRADAQAAIEEIKEVVCDFPFAHPRHRSTWLAALLTPLARHVFSGPAPLFLFDSNVSGSGKSLLTDAIAHVVLGTVMARTSYTQEDEELRKRITTIAMEGDPIVLIDNIPNGGSLGSPILDAALTSELWSDRLLGVNGSFKGRLRTIWYATGNNIQLRGDMQRRVLHSRLESPMERPTERPASAFRHPHLLQWIHAERPRLLRAALTVLRAHALAGRPAATGLAALGSYEAWSMAVRGPLSWLGEPDCAETQRELAASADQELSLLVDLHTGWSEVDPLLLGGASGGLTVRELLTLLDSSRTAYAALRSAVEEVCPSKSGKPPTSQALGKKLQQFKGRYVGGVCLDHVGYDEHLKAHRWGLRRAP